MTATLPDRATEDARPIDPTTLEPLGHRSATNPEDVEKVLDRAASAFAGTWPVDARLRARVLSAWAQRLREAADELATALVQETGKPVTEARVEVAGAADALDYNAGLARLVGGRAGTLPDGTEAHLVREPVGVTLFVVPWNWPVLLLLRDLAPALAAGVTAVVKPSPQTTLVTERLLRLGREAGLPEGVVEMIVGGREVGRAAIHHPVSRAVAFTGSTAAGEAILADCAATMTRPLLELGGKGAALVFPDAALDDVVAATVPAAVVTAGQMCMACTRLLVQREVYDIVLDRVVEAFRALRVGDPSAPATQVGPLISATARDRLQAVLAGTEVVVGGESVAVDGCAGAFMRPAVVTDVDPSSPVVAEDLFGPVLTVEPFDDEDDAVRLANATRFGLTSAVWTANGARAWRIARRLQAGTVWVNGYNRSYPEMPSGGFKSSGFGRTRGIEGVEQFTEIKHVHFSTGG